MFGMKSAEIRRLRKDKAELAERVAELEEDLRTAEFGRRRIAKLASAEHDKAQRHLALMAAALADVTQENINLQKLLDQAEEARDRYRKEADRAARVLAGAEVEWQIQRADMCVQLDRLRRAARGALSTPGVPA